MQPLVKIMFGGMLVCLMIAGGACGEDHGKKVTCFKCVTGTLGGVEYHETDNAPSCKDTFDVKGNHQLETCEGQCEKSITGAFGAETVQRKCSNTCKPSRTDIMGIKAYVSCCDEDKCNSAPYFSANRLTFALAAMMPLIVFLF